MKNFFVILVVGLFFVPDVFSVTIGEKKEETSAIPLRDSQPSEKAEEKKADEKTGVDEKKVDETEDDRLIRLISTLLEKEIPDKLESLKPEYKRIAFYTLTVDRTKVNPMLLHVIRGIIEAQFAKVRRVTLVEIPNLKPIKLITKDNSLVFTTGINSLEEMKKIGEEQKLDGFLEGVINITEKHIYLSFRIVDASNGGIVWSEYLSTTSIITQAPAPVKSVFKSEIDFGMGWLQVSEVSKGATPVSVPYYASYYMPEFRVYEKGWIGHSLSFGIGIGSLINVSGVDVSESSLVSPNAVGFGGLYVRGYLKVSFIPKDDPEMGDWFAGEFSGGTVLLSKPTGLSFFGVDFVSDISKHFSVSAGASYATPVEQLLSTTKVKIGGVMFNVFLLRYYFNR